MLRLKPTELTLTPEDVDDALRRMARRQQSKTPTAQTQRQTRYCGPPHPPPPRLMPGAQRSVRDAITHLGDIPSLQPQQAILAHVDDPASPASLRGGASRPRRSRVLSVGQEVPHASSPLRQTLIPSPAYSPEADSASSDEVYPRMHLKGYFVDSQPPEPRQVDGGDFASNADTTSPATYTFHEIVPRSRSPPHTEPFRRTSQPPLHSRSQSSTDVPPWRLAMPTTDAPYTASAEDVFWTAPVPVPIRRSPDQQNASPLPAEPYGRPSAGNLGTRFQQAIHRYVSADSSSREVSTNAMAATIEGRASPLDVLEAQIERASHHLGEHRRSHPEGARLTYRPRTSTHDHYQSSGLPEAAIGPAMAMADDPYTRGVSAHVIRSYGSTVHPASAQHAPTASYVAPPYATSAYGRRSGQRSSENAPVGSSSQERRIGRNSQVQDHVSAFEQMQNDAQPRHTRRQHEQQSSPIFGALMWGPQPHRARQRTALSPGHGNTGRRSARMDPRLQDQENSGDAETDMMRQELESARMRYDEDQQGHVMDETPPRIGRVERHM